MIVINNSLASFVSYFDSNYDFVKWHVRLEHIDQNRMRRLVKKGHLNRLTKVKLPRYKLCLASKATTKPFLSF